MLRPQPTLTIPGPSQSRGGGVSAVLESLDNFRRQQTRNKRETLSWIKPRSCCFGAVDPKTLGGVGAGYLGNGGGCLFALPREARAPFLAVDLVFPSLCPSLSPPFPHPVLVLLTLGLFRSPASRAPSSDEDLEPGDERSSSSIGPYINYIMSKAACKH